MLKVGLLLSFFMTIYLFYYALFSEKNIVRSKEKSNITKVFSIIMAFVFSALSYLFI
ncbi:hypothetical protein J6TS2_50420 [Heyndrickxia sporothermodurans]|nr:hypothetical protein J6TS2_50420 [Heyndrickxia sporothermodurans]